MKFKKIGEIGELVTLRVTSRGNVLYLRLPKSFCDMYNVSRGDMLKVHIQEHFRPVEEKENEHVDMGGTGESR